MGYVPKRKVYNIKFDDHEGLEVRATSTSTDAFIRISALAEDDHSNGDLIMLMTEFATVLKSWNLEEEGPDDTRVPVPATLEGLMSLELDFVQEIINGWMEAVAGVPAPLEQPLKDTATLLMEESIPMAPLPVNQAS